MLDERRQGASGRAFRIFDEDDCTPPLVPQAVCFRSQRNDQHEQRRAIVARDEERAADSILHRVVDETAQRGAIGGSLRHQVQAFAAQSATGEDRLAPPRAQAVKALSKVCLEGRTLNATY